MIRRPAGLKTRAISLIARFISAKWCGARREVKVTLRAGAETIVPGPGAETIVSPFGADATAPDLDPDAPSPVPGVEEIK